MPEQKVPLSNLVAIDPGDKYTGIVRLLGGRIHQSGTYGPEDALAYITSPYLLPHLDLMVIERYQLYPNQAFAQSWSSFTAIEIIGVMKYLASQFDVEVRMAAPPDINAFWKVRKIPSDVKHRLRSPHEVSAYRIAIWAQTMFPPYPATAGLN